MLIYKKINKTYEGKVMIINFESICYKNVWRFVVGCPLQITHCDVLDKVDCVCLACKPGYHGDKCELLYAFIFS